MKGRIKSVIRRIRKPLLIAGFAGITAVFAMNIFIHWYSARFIFTDPAKVPFVYTAIVPGALVMPSGKLSQITFDRAVSALELYQAGKVKRILVSGDHGTKSYDEVNTIRKFLLAHGVRKEDLFLDHAGFDTYSTMVRAQKVFCVKDAVIATQEFHLFRAVFIARMKGLEAYGFKADKRHYEHIRYYKFREIFANGKTIFEVMCNSKPRFLGEKIPVTGDSKKSWDQ